SHGCVDQAWGDDVYADVVRGVPRGGKPAQGDDAALRGRVGASIEKVRRRRETQDARHVEEHAGLSLAEKMTHRRTVGQEDRFEIRVERRLPAIIRAFVERTISVMPAADAGDM